MTNLPDDYPQGTGGIAEVMALYKDWNADFEAATVEAYEALKQRIKILESRQAGESPRVCINVSKSVKGVFTFDCTFEAFGRSWEDVKAESDALVATLVERYPTIEA